MRNLTLHYLLVAFVVISPYVFNLTLATPTSAVVQTSINQLLVANTTYNATSTISMPGISYEEYNIPETNLKLHLTLLRDLDYNAMQSCLQTATIWVGFQRQSDLIPKPDFEWKDPAGAVFYIRSLSKRLSWADVKNILRGLKESLEEKGRYLATSFTVEEEPAQLFVAQGRLSRYRHPEPTLLSVTNSATS